ncbi:PREDICTED: ribonuclease [Prunus dulcis]|uniref:PREDICTED: ribonuclease n=1 Tax=Prunus dulcis TaxID=3755 RepID=A0A5E4G9V7_PRUDU|nr:PREDICTED: ribonuclease [Prunus dulcis]
MAPLPSVCKINIDGSRINFSGLIGIGGLLRDSCGSWIKGFSVNLGYGSIIEAGLWGLNMAWDASFHMVEIECDATFAVALLKSLIVSTHPLFSIINYCKMKIHEDWCCFVKHIFHEQNCAADALAAKSYDFGPRFHVFLEAPAFLNAMLAVDV